ncbi:DUF4328 domain-containing protein [Streptomyces sp. NPDC001478]
MLRSPVGLGRAVCGLLGAVAAADVASIGAGFHARQVFGEATADDFLRYEDAAADRADMLYRAAGSLYVMVFLATAVVFLVWFRRVRLNAEVFDAHAHSMRPGWAIGGWFVPLGNVVLPHRVASDVWTASSPGGGGTGAPAPRGVLHAWWGTLLGATVCARYAALCQEQAGDTNELLHALDLGMVADGLDIAAAVLAILFVRRLTALQGERAAAGPDRHAAPSFAAERAAWRRAH